MHEEKGLVSGRVWICGDYVSAYQIIPQRRWTPGRLREDDLGRWALEDENPRFLDKPWGLRDTGCTILVAGKGFGGGGKSVEHPIYALKGAGIRVVLAESFGRYNYRNSINKGLPVFECGPIRSEISSGDLLTVNMTEGFVLDETNGKRFPLVPMAPFMIELIEAGGLLPYTKKHLPRG